MPIARFQMPDGRIGRFEVPEGTTPEQAQALIQESLPQDEPKSWGEVAKSAAVNFLPSAGGVVKDTVKGLFNAVSHPVDTLGNVSDLVAGAGYNAMPKGVQSLIDKVEVNPQAQQTAISKANLIGKQLKEKYGSTDALKETLSNDPAAVMADASTVLTGGGAILPKLGGLAAKVSAAGKAIDPMVLALQTAGKARDAVGYVAPKILGPTTGAGEAALSVAYKAGKEGGDTSKAFTSNMRGDAEMADVLDSAKQNLSVMQQAKQAEYRKNIASMKQDKSVLGFNGIDQAVSDAKNIVSFKGQVKNSKAADALQKIQDEVSQWKTLDPKEYHTPEGLDALKQKIGGLVEEIPFEQRTARLAAGKVYDAVRSEISKQAPEYASTMKAYSEASDQIKEIERALSLGNKAAADTSMRKLQSLMRNNVNTNYGNRLDLAKELEQQGGNQILPQLAGQALNDWAPRGIQRATTGATGLAAYSAGGIPAAAATAALSSPRLMGEALHLMGSSKRGADAVQKALKDTTKIDPQALANFLYQMDKVNQSPN